MTGGETRVCFGPGVSTASHSFSGDREREREQLKHMPPPYVERAITYKGTKRKRGCTPEDYEDDLLYALEDDCEQFQHDADN